MSIIENIVRLFAPHSCIACGAEKDMLLCTDCRSGLCVVPPCCYRCGVANGSAVVCDNCRPYTSLYQVWVRTPYRGAAKMLVHRLKFERARSGALEIADLLAGWQPRLPADVVLVHVPTATSRVRARGYDHAALLARHLARLTQIPQARLLARVGQVRQVGSNRAERLRQLQNAFRPVRPDLIRGRHIMLVDDVLTTGATLEAAAEVLKRAGARTVSAITFTRA